MTTPSPDTDAPPELAIMSLALQARFGFPSLKGNLYMNLDEDGDAVFTPTDSEPFRLGAPKADDLYV